jgi:hypothetical protein
MVDNQMKTFTKTEFIQAALAVAAYRSSIYARSWEIEAQIDAAETVEAVAALTWSWSTG